MKKIKVAPIGTCRIHTPLRRAALHYPFELDVRRNFGFVHTSVEVRQQLDLVLGGQPAPKAIWPLVYRATVTEQAVNGPAAEPEFFFFEISSRKHLTVDGHPIQINYLYRHVSEFFRVAHLAPEYWALTKQGRFTERKAWLESESAYQSLSPDRQDLLNQIHMQDQTDEQIADDMRYVADRVGADKCVFITHVNAIAHGGKVILSRQKLIETVSRLAAEMKLNCFNPTEDMHAFGQQLAMERGGEDSTHYALPFSEHIGAHWFETYIQPQMEGVDPKDVARTSLERRTIGRLDAMLSHGQMVKVSQELHAMMRGGRSDVHALRLLAKLSNQLGDYQRVIDISQTLAATAPLSDEDEGVLMGALLAVGQYQEAWDIGCRLLANEKEDDALLFHSAKAATALGLTDEAISLWSKLRSADEGKCDALIGLLQAYQQAGREAEAVAVAEQILLHNPDDEIALVAKWRDAIANPQNKRFGELVKQSKWFGDSTSLSLAKLADAHGNLRLAANLLAQKPHIFAKSEFYEADEMRSRWERMGKEALASDDFESAAHYLGAAARATEKESKAKALLKPVSLRFRDEVRTAYTNRDYAKVLRLAAVAAPYQLEFSGYHRIVGKAAVQTGDYVKALPYLQSDAAAVNSPAALLYLGRMASKAQDYLLAYRSYQAVMAHPNAQPDDVAAARQALTGRFGAALKQARHLAEQQSYDAAWALMDQLALASDDAERIAKERSRILRLVRLDFKAVDAENAPERLLWAEQYLRLDPSDQAMRRLAAVSAMRCKEYPLARDHWLALAAADKDHPQIEAALEKCAILIERAERRKAA